MPSSPPQALIVLLCLLHSQLLPEVRQVDFSLLDNKIRFDENGDPPNSFVIVQWRWDEDNHPFKKIAYYSTMHQKLLFGTDNISWHTPGNEASALHPILTSRGLVVPDEQYVNSGMCASLGTCNRSRPRLLLV